jgi:hypothetical protein
MRPRDSTSNASDDHAAYEVQSYKPNESHGNAAHVFDS